MRRMLVGSVLSLALVSGAMAQDQEKEEPARPAARRAQWRLAVQAWTYNRFTLFEAIDKAKEVGVTALEAYPGQALSPEHKDMKFDENLSAEGRELVKKKLQETGIRLVNYGVCGLNDEKQARKVFEFAKDMGIRTLVSEPPPAMMKTLDKMTEEFKMRVAIHDHPKPSPYWNPDFVLKAVEGCSKRIGACADTGHWVRSGLDPVECLKKLEGRVISLHFKDLHEKGPKGHDVPYGKGECNVKGQLEELKRQGFTGVFSIEYEYNESNPTPEVKECVAAFHRLAKELGVRVATPRRTDAKLTDADQ